MNIVVTGASTYGVNNMGDDAMLATLVEGLKRSFVDPRITFLARHVDEEYDNIFGFNSIKNLDHDNKKESDGRFFLGMNIGDETHNLHMIKNAIDEADLLIIGGNSFMEISSNEFLRGVSSYSATLAMLAKFCNTPYALYGVNVVDKITHDVTKQHARFLCENAVAVTMRENSGKNYLLKLGINGDNIYVTGDPAFGMKVTENKKTVMNILNNNKINLMDKITIGVCFRHEYWGGNNEDEYTNLNTILAKSLDEIYEELHCQFLFIPNCTYTKGHKLQDDRLTHQDVVSGMKNKHAAFEIKDQLSVHDTYRLFSLLDMHISNRRHSCIFASMNSIPFVTINGSFEGHLSPLLNELNIPEQLVHLDHKNNLTEKILETWKNKKIFVEKTKLIVEKLSEDSQKSISLLIG